jgi:hypothetical protein
MDRHELEPGNKPRSMKIMIWGGPTRATPGMNITRQVSADHS